MGLVACGGGGGDSPTAPVAGAEANIMKELENEADIPADESDKTCINRNNSIFKKLLTCVTLDGLRTHQAKWRDVAVANGGARVSGTKGFDE